MNSQTTLPWLDPNHPEFFPAVEQAWAEPNGLLAVGGDLSTIRLLHAYRRGIFPWYSDGQPILWWSPDPRMVFDTTGVRLSRRFRQSMRKRQWHIRFDQQFAQVIQFCANLPRSTGDGSWITQDMLNAYISLHQANAAHSVEVYEGDRLVGGLYGVSIGCMFFAESMFSIETGGSKIALAGLALLLKRAGWSLIDAQLENPHLAFMGAYPMPRSEYCRRIEPLCAQASDAEIWNKSLTLSEIFADRS